MGLSELKRWQIKRSLPRASKTRHRPCLSEKPWRPINTWPSTASLQSATRRRCGKWRFNRENRSAIYREDVLVLRDQLFPCPEFHSTVPVGTGQGFAVGTKSNRPSPAREMDNT